MVMGALRGWLSSESWHVWGCGLFKVNQVGHVEAKEGSVSGPSN